MASGNRLKFHFTHNGTNAFQNNDQVNDTDVVFDSLTQSIYTHNVVFHGTDNILNPILLRDQIVNIDSFGIGYDSLLYGYADSIDSVQNKAEEAGFGILSMRTGLGSIAQFYVSASGSLYHRRSYVENDLQEWSQYYKILDSSNTFIDGNSITINGITTTWQNTHYTSYFSLGTGKTDTKTDTNPFDATTSPYLKLVENATVRTAIRVKGSDDGIVEVKSTNTGDLVIDASAYQNIIVSVPTGLRLGTSVSQGVTTEITEKTLARTDRVDIALASGYSIAKDASQNNWQAGYAWFDSSHANVDTMYQWYQAINPSGEDTQQYIDTWDNIIAFLNGFKDTVHDGSTLLGYLTYQLSLKADVVPFTTYDSESYLEGRTLGLVPSTTSAEKSYFLAGDGKWKAINAVINNGTFTLNIAGTSNTIGVSIDDITKALSINMGGTVYTAPWYQATTDASGYAPVINKNGATLEGNESPVFLVSTGESTTTSWRKLPSFLYNRVTTDNNGISISNNNQISLNLASTERLAENASKVYDLAIKNNGNLGVQVDYPDYVGDLSTGVKIDVSNGNQLVKLNLMTTAVLTGASPTRIYPIQMYSYRDSSYLAVEVPWKMPYRVIVGNTANDDTSNGITIESAGSQTDYYQQRIKLNLVDLSPKSLAARDSEIIPNLSGDEDFVGYYASQVALAGNSNGALVAMSPILVPRMYASETYAKNTSDPIAALYLQVIDPNNNIFTRALPIIGGTGIQVEADTTLVNGIADDANFPGLKFNSTRVPTLFTGAKESATGTTVSSNGVWIHYNDGVSPDTSVKIVGGRDIVVSSKTANEIEVSLGYDDFKPGTNATKGTKGLVPAPPSASQGGTYYLTSNGGWTLIPEDQDTIGINISKGKTFYLIGQNTTESQSNAREFFFDTSLILNTDGTLQAEAFKAKADGTGNFTGNLIGTANKANAFVSSTKGLLVQTGSNTTSVFAYPTASTTDTKTPETSWVLTNTVVQDGTASNSWTKLPSTAYDTYGVTNTTGISMSTNGHAKTFSLNVGSKDTTNTSSLATHYNNRLYQVRTDKDNKLAVDVPWESVIVTETTGISLTRTTGQSVTLKLNVGSKDTTNTSAASTYIANRFYRIVTDKDNYLGVVVPWTYTNTWRDVSVDGAKRLDTGTNTGSLNFIASTGISAGWDSTNNAVKFTGITKNLNFNGTNYAILTSSSSLPTIYAANTNNTEANQVWASNGDNTAKAWRTLNTKAFNTGITLADLTNNIGDGLNVNSTKIRVSLKDYTKNANDISGKLYPVELDKSGRLAVNVPWTYTNTWRQIYVNGESKLATGTNTQPLNFKAGSNVSLAFDTSTLTINSSYTNTWREIKINGSSCLSSTDSTALNLISGNNISFNWDSDKKLTISAEDTWIAFVGASSSSNGIAGYIPAPGSGNQDKFFRADGTWQAISQNVTTSLFVGGSNSTADTQQTQNGNVYLTLKEGSTYTRKKIYGSGGASVSCTSTGDINIYTPSLTGYVAKTGDTMSGALTVPTLYATGSIYAQSSGGTYLFYTTDEGVFHQSDRNVKDNIEVVSDSDKGILSDLIDKDEKLIKSFVWKSSGKKSYGFIAQDVEEWCPEAVDEKDGVKSVNYNIALSKLSVGIYAKVAEQEKIIENQQKQIDELKALVEKLLSK